MILKILAIIIGKIALIELTILFKPVEDKPGYYWFNKRNYQIISEEVLKKAIKDYENSNILFLSNKEFHS
jgi:hypothetical protein